MNKKRKSKKSKWEQLQENHYIDFFTVGRWLKTRDDLVEELIDFVQSEKQQIYMYEQKTLTKIQEGKPKVVRL